MGTKKSTTTAAMYLRQSLDRDGNQLAVSRQREDCLKLCQAKNWQPVEYVDNDRSASNGKTRPAYQRMLTDIANGKIGAVVVWDLDRLHRQPRELEDFIDLADAKAIALATVTGEVDLSTDNGRLTARIKGAVARAEMERKSARQKRAALQRAQSGRVWTPCRVFGYTTAQSDGSGMTVDKTEAKVLRKLYSDVLAGRSLLGLARELNAKGVKTSRGNTWRATTLREVLISPRYAGLRSYKGEILGKADWPAIVDEADWRGAVAKLSDPQRKRPPKAGYTRKYLLTGLIHCGCCDGTMSGSTHTTGHSIYVCRKCQKVSRSAEKVDKYVLDLVTERLSRPDAAELLVSREREGIAALQDKANALRARQDEIAGQLTELSIPVATVKARLADIGQQIADIEAKVFDTSKAHIFEGVIGVKNVRRKLDSLPLDRQRAIVRTLLTVTVHPGQPPRGGLRLDLLPPTWKQ